VSAPLLLLAWAVAAPLPDLADAVAVAPVDRVELRVEASVGASLARVDVDVTARYTPAVDLDEVPVVLAAERYRTPGPLSPSEVREAFPSGFSPGGFDDLVLELDGARCTPRIEVLAEGERIAWCPRVVAAGQPVVVRARATLRVPERYGGFGRVGRSLTLAGGWLPLPGRPGAAPPRGPWALTLSAPAELMAVVGSAPRPSAGERGRRVVVATGEGAQVPLVLRPGAWRALSLAEGQARFLTGSAPQGR